VFILISAFISTAAAGKEDLLKECTAAKDRGEYTQAISYCSQALALDSSYVDALYWRASSQIKLKNYSAAIIDLSQELQLQPLDAEAWSLLGTTYRRSGNLALVYCDAKRALEIDAKFSGGYMTRALIFDDMSQHDKAIEDYTRAIENNPKLVEAFNNRGNSYAALNRYSEAVSDFSQAIEIYPQFADAFFNRGYIYFSLGRYDEAIADLSKVVEINPQDAHAFGVRGSSYAVLGRTREAVSDFQQFLAMAEPNNKRNELQKFAAEYIAGNSSK